MQSLEFRPLRADEIDVRIGTMSENGASLLLYKDARCDMNILDETVGAENWQRSHEVINGNLFCNVGIKTEGAGGVDAWVWKQDVGTESFTEKEKGEASDSFKRACFNWGIGRELYTSPFIWIPAGSMKIVESKGRKTTHDKFHVVEISYQGRAISGITIANKKNETVFSWHGEKKEEQPKEVTCLVCGNVLPKSIKMNNGETLTARQFSKDFGGKCPDCVKNERMRGVD